MLCQLKESSPGLDLYEVEAELGSVGWGAQAMPCSWMLRCRLRNAHTCQSSCSRRWRWERGRPDSFRSVLRYLDALSPTAPHVFTATEAAPCLLTFDPICVRWNAAHRSEGGPGLWAHTASTLCTFIQLISFAAVAFNWSHSGPLSWPSADERAHSPTLHYPASSQGFLTATLGEDS